MYVSKISRIFLLINSEINFMERLWFWKKSQIRSVKKHESFLTEKVFREFNFLS